MMTPPPINDRNDPLEDEEEEIKRRGFNRRVHIEQRALGFAASGSEGLPEHRGGRFAYQLRDEQRLRNVAGVPQAIVKVIPGGGVGSRGELVAQLNYLSRDGTQELEQGGGPGGYQIEGQDAIRDVAVDWAMAWEDAASRDGRTARAKSKSFHLLVSYPEGTDPDMAQMAAEAFTDQLCQSGEYGDRWRYIAAWHTDRPHPHMHIVIDRLGASGRMMQIHPAKTINPKSLRALQVDTAIEYGIALNDTPRVSRGHRDRGLSSPEWRAEQRGERRERSPTRQVYDKTASGFTEDAIGREANELKKLSGRYRNADTPERRADAKALEKAAFILSSGGTLDGRSHKVVKHRHPEEADAWIEKRKKHERPSFEIQPHAVSIPQEVPRDAIADEFADLVSETRVNAKDHSERKLNPQRRMTEQELREHLAVEERKLTERQQRVEAEQEKIGNPRSIDTDVMPPIPTDHGAQNAPDPEMSNQRDTDTQGQTQPQRRLTEAELREVLNRGVRKLNEAEKQRRPDVPGKSKDSGIDFGFD